MPTISCDSSALILCVVFILPFLFIPSYTELVATSRTKLPNPDTAHSLWYDGQDDIYIFGGGHIWSLPSLTKRIMRYSLSTDSIHFVGSLPLTARYGSVHSDLDGNLFYFGAEETSIRQDKVLKYSPTTNSSSVVATLPHSIYGMPTIKLDANTVLILGRSVCGPEIISFDLASGKFIILPVSLPTGVCFDGATKFGKDKAYLFSIFKETSPTPDSGFMWELDLQTMKFKEIHDPISPKFLHYPTMVTDDTFIYVFAMFRSNSVAADREGIFQIEPVSMTTQFLSVANLPLLAGSTVWYHPPPAVYVPKMRRIYCFGGSSVNVTDSHGIVERDEIFYLNLNPLPKVNQITFVCSNWLQGESSKCTPIDKTNGLNPFSRSRFPKNVTCRRTGLSQVDHYEKQVVNIHLVKSSLGKGCDFVIDFLDIGSRLDCRLENGGRISLTFDTDNQEVSKFHYEVIGLATILVTFLLTGFIIRNCTRNREARVNHAVVWEANAKFEME